MTQINFKFNERKATEAATVLLSLYNKRMKYKKLIKLLYLADRLALDKYERPITNDRFVSMKQGQVLSNIYNLIKGEITSEYWHKFIRRNAWWWIALHTEKLKIEELSESEVEVLEEIFKDYGHFTGNQLGKITHDLPEYVDPLGSSRTTPVEEVLKKGLGFNQEDINRIASEVETEDALDTIFLSPQ